MEKTIALAAVFATISASSHAAFLMANNSQLESVTQPTLPRVLGTRFTTSADTVLDKFAIYDSFQYEGDGWTAANAKTVSLYQLSGGNYSRIATRVMTTNPEQAIGDLLPDPGDLYTGGFVFRVDSFSGLGVLPAGSYFIGMSEIKPDSQQNLDGWLTVASPLVTNPDATAVGLVSWSTGFLQDPVSGIRPTSLPESFDASAIWSPEEFDRSFGVIPSIISVPECGSSAMVLSLGAIVLRFRSRRA